MHAFRQISEIGAFKILRYVCVHVRMATRNTGLRPFNKVLLWLVRVLLAIRSIMYTLLSCESCGLVFEVRLCSGLAELLYVLRDFLFRLQEQVFPHSHSTSHNIFHTTSHDIFHG